MQRKILRIVMIFVPVFGITFIIQGGAPHLAEGTFRFSFSEGVLEQNLKTLSFFSAFPRFYFLKCKTVLGGKISLPRMALFSFPCLEDII